MGIQFYSDRRTLDCTEQAKINLQGRQVELSSPQEPEPSQVSPNYDSRLNRIPVSYLELFRPLRNYSRVIQQDRRSHMYNGRRGKYIKTNVTVYGKTRHVGGRAQ